MKVSIIIISKRTRINNLNLNFSWGYQYSLDTNIRGEYLNPYPLSWLPRTNSPHDEIPRFHDVASADLVWPMKISGVKFDFWRTEGKIILFSSQALWALEFPNLAVQNWLKETLAKLLMKNKNRADVSSSTQKAIITSILYTYHLF